MKNKIKIPIYLKKIIKLDKNLVSGRKNFLDQHIRILKNIQLVKKFLKK